MDDQDLVVEFYSFFSLTDIHRLIKSNLPNDLKMSLMKRFFRRSKRIHGENPPPAEQSRKCDEISEIPKEDNKTLSQEGVISQIKKKDETIRKKREDLKIAESFLTWQTKKHRKQEQVLNRMKNDAVSLERETKEVLRLTTLSKLQTDALEEDILNKKCDLKYLKTEAPENIETEIKKREPMYFKKYTNLKSATEAKNLLTMVRQRQRALQHLELLVYNKYVDFQYNLKSDEVKRRTSLFMKDKEHNFGHFQRALQSRSTNNPSNTGTTSDSEAPRPHPFSLVTSTSPVFSPHLFSPPVVESFV